MLALPPGSRSSRWREEVCVAATVMLSHVDMDYELLSWLIWNTIAIRPLLMDPWRHFNLRVLYFFLPIKRGRAGDQTTLEGASSRWMT